MNKITLILGLFLVFISCEKDDICDESTTKTPLLVVEFFQYGVPLDQAKNVTNLKIKASTATDFYVFNSTATDNTKYLANNINKIQIPLQVDANFTHYTFTLNSTDTASITDDIQFNYTTQDLFVSRACGYKSVFNLNTTNPITTSNNWIESAVVNQYFIENQKVTHVKIYF